MAFRQEEIRKFTNFQRVRESVASAKLSQKRTAFLCHSHKDADLAKGLQGFLHTNGWEVYIDWEDVSMPDRPDRVTAARIQEKIRDLEMFFFLATQNSMASRWCPWEIGYADGVKPLDRILVVPTQDNYGTEYGNEYLQLYRHLDFAANGGLGHFGSDNRGRVLKESAKPFS